MCSFLPDVISYLLEHTDLCGLCAAARLSIGWRDAAAAARNSRRLLVAGECSWRVKMRWPCALALTADAKFLLSAEEKQFRIVHLKGNPRGEINQLDQVLYDRGVALPIHRGSTGPSGMAFDCLKNTLYVRRGSNSDPLTFPDHHYSRVISELSRYVTDDGVDRLYRCGVLTPAAAPYPDALPGISRPSSVAGGFGTEPGCLCSPGDVCLGQDGLVFVAEGRSISAFVEGGDVFRFSHKIGGSQGDGPSQFRQVGGLAALGGELYACDVRNHRIQCFEQSTGSFLRSFGRKGDRPGEFRRPTAIAALSRHGGRLVVSEMTGKRLQVFDKTGALLQLLTIPSNDGLGGTRRVRLSCLCADEDNDRVFAAEASRRGRLHQLKIR